MSKDNEFDDLKRIPSNEELVDSLVENFKSTCLLKPKDDDSKILEQESPSITNSQQSSSQSEFSNPENESKEKQKDFIDEEALKIVDKNYTDEERIRLKSKSEDLKATGNKHFKSQEYQEAADVYTLALRTCPLNYSIERAILYANRGAAKLKLGFTESALEDCTRAIELDPTYVKAILRRAQLYESTEKFDEALEDFNKILKIDPSHAEANYATRRLPILINERNEKLKTEMMGKLKDLGNVILRPFGLSTNNFQMVQDPNTGGYSISFKN